MVRALLVDDHPTFLTVIQAELAALRELIVVGYAQSGQDALEQVQQLQPDLVILDIAMPGMNGLEVARRIKARTHSVAVVLVSMHDTLAYRSAGMSVADGFVAKDMLDIHLLPLVARLFPALAINTDRVDDEHFFGD
jgi:DNA-binding NarL/FixJ family response regulator